MSSSRSFLPRQQRPQPVVGIQAGILPTDPRSYRTAPVQNTRYMSTTERKINRYMTTDLLFISVKEKYAPEYQPESRHLGMEWDRPEMDDYYREYFFGKMVESISGRYPLLEVIEYETDDISRYRSTFDKDYFSEMINELKVTGEKDDNLSQFSEDVYYSFFIETVYGKFRGKYSLNIYDFSQDVMLELKSSDGLSYHCNKPLTSLEPSGIEFPTLFGTIKQIGISEDHDIFEEDDDAQSVNSYSDLFAFLHNTVPNSSLPRSEYLRKSDLEGFLRFFSK